MNNPSSLLRTLHKEDLEDCDVGYDSTTDLVREQAPFRRLVADARAGNITGEITGTVVPVGAANELVPANTDGSHSFLTNQYTINTTAPAESTLIMDVQAIVNYANEALYGLYKVQFLGPLDVFGEDIIFGTFVASMQSEFEIGRGIVDVWRVVPNGRIDGQAIPALLPPGQSE